MLTYIKLISFANNIGLTLFEIFGKSLIFKINKSGPRTNPYRCNIIII